MEELGIVVVGLGIAGKVRVRDLLSGEHLEKVSLKGYVSRRTDQDVEGSEALTATEALKRSDVHAVIVSTENTQHHETISAALSAGKHVLVEFPLVVDFAQVAPLYTMAKDKGVVLYEEDIALLTPQHAGLRQLVKDKTSKLIRVHNKLSGSIRGDMETYLSRTGHPLYAALSMLQCLLDVLGDLTPCRATMQQTATSINVHATLRTMDADSSEVVMEIERIYTEKPMRTKSFSYEFDDGTLIDEKQVPFQMSKTSPGLFLQDLMQFVDVVRGKRENTYSEWLTRRSLDITSQLVSMTTTSSSTQ